MGSIDKTTRPTSRPGWALAGVEHDAAAAERVLGHPLLIDVFRQWQGLCRNGEPPAREDLDPLIFKPGVFPQLLLMEGVERNGVRDLRYRLVGVGLARDFGGDVTGRYVRDVFADPVHAEELVARSYLVIDRRQPVVSIRRSLLAERMESPMTTFCLGLPMKRLPSGTPILLTCQLSARAGVLFERPARKPIVCEPAAVFILVDRSPGGRAPQ